MRYQDVNSMRVAILAAYHGPRWEEKVRRMSDTQVIAVYYSFKENGKLEKREMPRKGCAAGVDRGRRSDLPVLDDYRGLGTATDDSAIHQLTMDELLGQM